MSHEESGEQHFGYVTAPDEGGLDEMAPWSASEAATEQLRASPPPPPPPLAPSPPAATGAPGAVAVGFDADTGGISDTAPFETLDGDYLDDPDEEWVTTTKRKGIRVPLLTGILVLLVAAAGGFYGGVALQKHHGSGTSSALSAAASRFAAAARAGGGRFGGSGAGGTGFGGGAGTGTVGIVTEVQGQTLYLTGSNGNLIKVTLSPQSTITKTSTIAATGLQVGDQVVVQGTTNSDGSFTATSVSDGAAAATPGSGGIGGAGAAG